MSDENRSLIEVNGAAQPTQLVVQADFGAVFLKQMPDGTVLRSVKAKMALLEDKGHIYKVGGKWAISGSGYTHLNKVAAINLVTPEYVMVDGMKRPNPHVERDPHTRTVLTVNVRKIGVGFSPTGNITVIDKTLYYNVFTYFIQSVQAKMNAPDWDAKPQGWKKGEPLPLKYPGCAVVGTRRRPPAADDDKAWAFFPTMPPLGLWVDYKHPGITACLEEHTQRQRFGDRIAQKIVERNILKDHPAIGVSQVDASGEKYHRQATVTVYGYKHEMAAGDVQAIGQAAAKGATAPEGAIADAPGEGEVKVQPGVVVEPTPEEEAAVAAEEAEAEANGKGGQQPLPIK